MRITKFGHACVRISHDGAEVVIDPGGFTDPSAVDGATAVLITHQHADHYDATNLRATDAPIWTIEAVAREILQQAPDLTERVTVIAPEQRFDVGVPVRAVGEKHAVIHPDYDRFDNSGYVLTLGVAGGDVRIYHPGDALTPPGEPVDLLCLPVSAPWLKISEAIDFGREVAAPRNLAIHDRVYSAAGLGMADTHFGNFLAPAGQDYARLADGEELSPLSGA